LKKPSGYDQRVVMSWAGHFVLISGIKGCLYGNLGICDKWEAVSNLLSSWEWGQRDLIPGDPELDALCWQLILGFTTSDV
jgi:hypothetical protein